MIKVLNITITPLWTDGISNSLINYFEHIDNNQIQIGFACPDVITELEEKIKKRNGNIHKITAKRNRVIPYILELKKIIKNNKYDIVHIHGSSAMLCIELIAAIMAGCKHRIVHSRNTKSDHPKLDKILRPIFNVLYTDQFACGTDAGKWLFGNNKEFTIIPNGKNFQLFKFNEKNRTILRKKYNIKNNEIVLGHIGNFNYQKNHEYLIEIFYEICKKHKNYKLVLCGIGGQLKKIQEKLLEYGINDKVYFLGQVSNQDVAKWLSAMDIMVFPSRFEGFPNVLIEWQMAGIPSIISDKITKDVKITNLVQFESIEKSPIDWANKITKVQLYDRTSNITELQKQITKAGYDIEENGKMLEQQYINIYNKK